MATKILCTICGSAKKPTDDFCSSKCLDKWWSNEQKTRRQFQKTRKRAARYADEYRKWPDAT